MMTFFGLVQHALEFKLGTSAEALLASGPALDAEPDLDPDAKAASTAEHRARKERFGKKCLAFLGSQDCKLKLLLLKVRKFQRETLISALESKK